MCIRDSTYAINPRTATAAETIRRYAKDHRLLVWDMYDVVGGLSLIHIWQSLLPEASIAGSVDHTIKAAEMKLNDMSFKMGQDGPH